MDANEIKTQLRIRALAFGFTDEEVDEYISEAEHQDGESYWSQFANVRDAIADFVLYWQSHD